MRRYLALALPVALLVAFSSPSSAQERSWSISVFTDAGGLIPIRSLGKNSGNLQELEDQQVLADMDNAVSWGAGVELLIPASSLRLQAKYNATQGGGVSGRIAFCGDPGNPLLTGELCEPITADATLHSFSVDVAFLRAALDRRFRPVVFLGLGLRKYEVGLPTCPPLEPLTYRGQACILLTDLWIDDGGITPTLRFGLGFDFDLGPVEFRASAVDVIGRYPGGTGTSDGHGQNDISLSAGIAVKVF